MIRRDIHRNIYRQNVTYGTRTISSPLGQHARRYSGDRHRIVAEEQLLNCWEYHHCGREPGGSEVNELGVCPAATEEWCDGINRGSNAGRYCWAIAGTFCRGEIQGHFAVKFGDCRRCGFFRKVIYEEDKATILVNDSTLDHRVKEKLDQLNTDLTADV